MKEPRKRDPVERMDQIVEELSALYTEADLILDFLCRSNLQVFEKPALRPRAGPRTAGGGAAACKPSAVPIY